MARLTILQASQQGFGSTLTLHRLIKDGSLPIYEEGDAKLIEVDDLITLLGEPAGMTANTNTVSDPAAPATPGQIDIYEYNRMKSELDQKNKKNMWLAADLAEVVREMKEKEVKFEAERTRLLKVLEQAQALLLREAKRAGDELKRADGSPLPLDQGLADNGLNGMLQGAHEYAPQEYAPQAANPEPQWPGSAPAPEAMLPSEMTSMDDQMPSMAAPMGEDRLAFDNGAPSIEPEWGAGLSTPDPVPTDGFTGLTTEVAPEIDTDLSATDMDGKAGKKKKKRSKARKTDTPVNPLTPPLDGEEEEAPRKSGLLRTTMLILLVTLIAVGAVVLKFRHQIMSSVANIMKTVGGT